MGNCYSKDTERTAAAAAACVAMEAVVVTTEGDVLRTQGATAAAEVVKSWGDGYFLCDSDSLYVGRRITDEHMIREDELLKAGKLYFVLPLRMLHSIFTSSDMAALLLRATGALRFPAVHESNHAKGQLNKIQPLLFLPSDSA